MTVMPFSTLMNALKKPSSAYVAISAFALIGAAVGISAPSSASRAIFQQGNTFSDTRLMKGDFRWPTPVGVTVSTNTTMSSNSTSTQNIDSNTVGSHREQTSFRWENAADAGESRKMTATSIQYVPPMLRTYKHSIEFDGY
jgi:hypothetical protein